MDFLKAVQRSIQAISGSKLKIQSRPSSLVHGVHRIRWVKKEYVENLERMANDFPTSVKEYEIDFIRGFFDSEGSIDITHQKYIRIRVSNKNKELLGEVQKMLWKLGFHTSNVHRCGRVYELSLHGWEQAKKFITLIRPSIKRKVRIVLGEA